MSSYFTVPSFAKAKKKQDEQPKNDTKEPVLNKEDEKFLQEKISSDEAKSRIIFSPVKDEDDAAAVAATGDASTPERPSPSDPKPQWAKSMALPSQEDAEAITHNYHDGAAAHERGNAKSTASDEKRTWASYIPSIPSLPSFPSLASRPSSSSSSSAPSQTWSQFASSYIPPALQPSRTDADAGPVTIRNADGTVNASASLAQQEKEVGVLLASLDATTLHARVFALSAETRELYGRFAQVLRDTIAGVPSAYDDMDRFCHDAGPTLEAQFRALPPFVQSLVRTLPAKLGGVVAPEILAKAVGGGATEKEAGTELGVETEGKGKAEKGKQKKRRRRIPGLKSLMGKKGALAGMLRATVEFVQVRFPFLASMTNVVMSLAVFVLMFVCWYCYKRGKEVRMAREADANEAGESLEADLGSSRAETTDSGSEDESEGEDPELEAKIAKEIEEKLHESETTGTGSSPEQADRPAESEPLPSTTK